MREKLEKLEGFLRGDSNPRWTVVYELLKEIVDKLEPESKKEDKSVDDLWDRIVKDVEIKSDKLINRFNKIFDKF